MIAAEPLKPGDRVRHRSSAYSGMKGTIDTLERSAGGAQCAWVFWDIPDDERAITGCYFLISDLERLDK